MKAMAAEQWKVRIAMMLDSGSARQGNVALRPKSHKGARAIASLLISDLTARHSSQAKTLLESHELSNSGYNAGRRGQLEVRAGQEARRLLSLNKLEEGEKTTAALIQLLMALQLQR